MQAILTKAKWRSHSPEELSAALRVAGSELLEASALLDGALDDDAMFLEDDHGVEGKTKERRGPKKIISRL